MSISIYRIESDLTNCLFTARVNDLPFIRQFKNMPFYSKTTLNEWLIKGVNTIVVTLSFDYNVNYSADTEASFHLYKIDSKDVEEKHKVEILKFSLPKYQEGVMPSFKLVQQFVVVEDVFENVLDNLVPTELDTTMTEKLYGRYYEVFQTLKNKDLDGYLSLMRKKELAYASLYDTAPSVRIAETRNSIGDLVGNPGNVLFELNRAYLKVQVYNYGKVIALEDIEGNPCIFFFNRKENIAHFLPFFCAVEKGQKEFSVIR
jgi:hypothetical protein